jgi:hypothetical protein
MSSSIFLRLTDYVSGPELCELSPDVLQEIVCGSDGGRLDTIHTKSGVDTLRFISTPLPGFYVKSHSSKNLKAAVTDVVEILKEIKRAATKSQVVSPSYTGSKTPSFKDAFYHPLYSASQYHLMPALLPTPMTSGSSSPQPLSDEECERILQSPYLSALKKRSQSPPEESVSAHGSSFDKELEGCLPGVPGVRQSKEYKRIRRKISEIDDLLKSQTLDQCQRNKVARRPEYVVMLRRMLLEGIPEKQETSSPIEVSPEVTDPSSFQLETGASPLVEPEIASMGIEMSSRAALPKRVSVKNAPRRTQKINKSRFVPERVAQPISAKTESDNALVWLFTIILGLLGSFYSRTEAVFTLIKDAWTEFFIGTC